MSRRRSQRRDRRRGGRAWVRLLVLVLLCSSVVGIALDGTAAFDAAALEREPGADVVTDENGVLSLDVAADVHTGTTENLVDTSNSLDSDVSVTVRVTGAATDYGDLVVDGTNVGDSTTFTLTSGDAQQVEFQTVCDSGVVGEAVTFNVSVDGDGLSGTADRSVPIDDGNCDLARGVVYATPSDRDLRTVRNGSSAAYDATSVQVTGPMTADLDDDGRAEIPYVNGSNGDVFAVDRNNESTQLLDASALSGVLDAGAETDKTKMATGVWNESGHAVFFVDDGESYVYYANETDTVEIVEASNGASAVVGVLDFDGDGATEIVFVDGSAQLRYVEEDGSTIRKVSNGGIGSNNGVGAGAPADFDGDGTPRVPFVDGSNVLSVVTADGTRTKLSTDGNSISADKAPVASFDWDDDGDPEILFRDAGVLYVADDIGDGTATVTRVTVDGSDVSVAAETGAA